jgi:hypothetical protein
MDSRAFRNAGTRLAATVPIVGTRCARLACVSRVLLRLRLIQQNCCEAVAAAAARALVKELAGIDRHGFTLRETADRTN